MTYSLKMRRLGGLPGIARLLCGSAIFFAFPVSGWAADLDLNGGNVTLPSGAFFGGQAFLNGSDGVGNTNAAAASLTSTGGNAVYSGFINETNGTIAIHQIGGNNTFENTANNFSGGFFASGGATIGIGGVNGSLGTGTVTLDSGTTLRVDNFGITLANAVVLNGAGIVKFDTNAHDDFVLSGVVSGNGTFEKAAGGTLTLTGINTYDGGTRISDGVLSVSTDENLGDASGDVTITSGSAYNPGTGGGATSTLLATASFTSARTVNFGNFGGRLETSAGTTLTLSGLIAGGGGASFIKQGDGTLVLTGDSSGATATTGFLGTTRINGGMLRIEGGGKLGSASAGAGYISNGATMVVTDGSSWTTGGQIIVGDQGSGTLRIENGGKVSSNNSGIIGLDGASSASIDGGGSEWTSSGADFYVGHFNEGTLTVSDNGALNVGGGTGTINAGLPAGSAGGTINIGAAYGAPAAAAGQLLAGAVALNVGTSRLVFNHTDGGYAFKPDITGPGSVYQAAGTTILNGTNSYTGDTVIEGGTLVAGVNTALSADSVVYVDQGGTLDIADGVQADIKGLFDGSSGHGGIINIGTTDDSTVLYVGYSGPVASDFSGQITGAGSLELDQGSLTLRGASTIGGDLYVSPDATLTLFGPGASFDVAGGTFGISALPGVEADGSLNMLAGAKLTTDNLLVGGVMLVDGAGTKATVAQLTFVGSMANAAVLTIQKGAVVDSLFGAVIENPFDAARAVVSGPGSTWNISTFLGVGNMLGGGTGTLAVTKGGVVNVGDTTVIASDPTSTGLGPSEVIVTGAGSKLVTDTLIVGLPPCVCGDPLPGQLFVADGGAVVASKPVVIEEGSLLSIGSGGLSGSLVAPSIGNNGRIQANFTDSVTLDAPISGSGTLSKYNTGTLVLNGASTYTGATTVYGGKLVVGDSTHPGASLASTVTLKSGASLGGIGTLGGLAVENGATIAPGNSIGTLNIAGDVSFAAGSTYAVEIGGNGTSDRIAATGKATLGGGTVSVTALDPETSYQDGQTYTILTAAGGVTGGFDPAVLARSAFLEATLAQSTNAVDLKIAIKKPQEPGGGKPVFAKVANTYNQKQTAGALDTLQQSGAPLALYNKLLLLSADEGRAAFDSLSGEVNASTVTGLIEDSRFVREAINDRLRSAFETVGAEPLPPMGYGEDAKAITTASVASERYGAWGSVFGSWGHFGGDGNAARLNRSIGGFVTGVDGLITDDVRLGFVAGYSHSSLKVDDRRSSASSDNYHLGIYGGTEIGALSLRSGLAYTWSEIDTSRQVAFPGFSDSLTGSYRAGTTQLFGELGYGIKAGNLAFEPFANLAYVNVHTNGFNETGGASALSVHSGSNDNSFTTLGIRASTDFEIGSTRATARGMIGWRHAYGDVTPEISQAFTGSSAFTIAGAPIAKDAAVIEAGLDFAIAPRATLGISYHGQAGSKTSDHGVRADLNVKF
ncbi:autotransporter domain-containing protein [Mesorhizobium sp. UC74_2]|uniref:autotransporter outer membrane beta-barrel domain-containing protein n=1 Tax=Mesorhizobium sp. UC74_2 TaxID=3350171 RepID=UPI00366B3E06